MVSVVYKNQPNFFAKYVSHIFYKISSCSYPLQNMILSIFNFSPSSECIMISQHDLDLPFPEDQ